jgi:hypothetical protein
LSLLPSRQSRINRGLAPCSNNCKFVIPTSITPVLKPEHTLDE